MAGKTIVHRKVTWASGIVRKISEDNYAIDLMCSRCGDRTHRQYCCFDKAKELGLECYAKLHVGCTEKTQKERIC